MPLLNCKKRFVQPIKKGTKPHTVRCGKRPFKVGDTLYMQTGPRFHPVRFCTKKVIRVRDITITDESVTVMNEGNMGFISADRELFAKADGFESWSDLCAFFREMHFPKNKNKAIRFTIEGQLVQWAVAPWELHVAGARVKGGCVFTSRCKRVGPCYWQRCRFYKGTPS